LLSTGDFISFIVGHVSLILTNQKGELPVFGPIFAYMGLARNTPP
jgi:hypothetical protein